MKRLTVGLYSPEQINAMEMAINTCLFSYLSAEKNEYSTPFEAVENYVKGDYIHCLHATAKRRA
jgi:hypothetical protein